MNGYMYNLFGQNADICMSQYEYYHFINYGEENNWLWRMNERSSSGRIFFSSELHGIV